MLYTTEEYNIGIEWVSEWLLFNAKGSIYFCFIMATTAHIRWDNDDVCFALDQHS